MNHRQRLVQERFLDNEERIIKRLDQVYSQSMKDLNKTISQLDKSIGELQKVYASIGDDDIGDLAAAFFKGRKRAYTPDEARETLQSMIQSKVYQKDFQKAMQKQVGGILADMRENEYKAVSDYIQQCYEEAFVGTLYDLHGQGIPLCFPLDQEAMVRAVQLDSKISQGLYKRLGEDVPMLKKKIVAQVSRGISTGMSWQEVAQQLAGVSKIGYNNAVRIARTEGHRVQSQSCMDACYKAQERGADLVKQWDAALDSRTRESHAAVDGEIRELDEKFSNGLMFPGDPSGEAAEVINCRCRLLQRARWALGGSFTKMNNFTKQLETFESPKAYDEFKKGFFTPENKAYMNYVQQMQDKYHTRDFVKVLDAMTEQEYKKYSRLLNGNPSFNTKAPVKPTFTPAKTLEEAEEYGKRFIVKKTWSGNGEISYKGLSVDNANKLNETLTDLFSTYDLPPFENIKPMNFRQNIWKGSENAPFAYRSLFNGELYFNPKIAKTAKAFDDYFKKGEEAFEICKKNIDRFTGSQREMVERYVKAGRQLVADDAKDRFVASVQHEMGHHIQNQILWKNKDAITKMNDHIDEFGVKISGYATSSKGEYVAESFCAFMNGESDRIDPFMKEYFEGLMK